MANLVKLFFMLIQNRSLLEDVITLSQNNKKSFQEKLNLVDEFQPEIELSVSRDGKTVLSRKTCNMSLDNSQTSKENY